MSYELALGLFRKACGLSVPLALVCQDASSSAGAYAPLDYPRPFMLIGRLPAADLSLNHDDVSRRHAYLQAVEGRLYCIDLESRTKTHWKGQEGAPSRGWLDPSGSIQVGPYRIHRTDLQINSNFYSGMADPFSPQGNEESDLLRLPRATFELPFRVGGRSTTWAPNGLLALVGRCDRCQLALTDNNISQYHACLVRTPLGIWIVDLAAREGVYVNETRVRWAWLADGDRVRMGPFTMTLQYEDALEGIARQDAPLAAGAVPAAAPASRFAVAAPSSETDRRVLAIRSDVRSTSLARAEPHEHASLAAVPAATDDAKWESVLPDGPNPLAMWDEQMQMMQSFHNDMVMMFQMFVAMHRENLDSVRYELDRVEKLTHELTLLKTKLGQLPGLTETSPTSAAGEQRERSRVVPQMDTPRPDRGPRPLQPGKRTDRKPSGNADGKRVLTGDAVPVPNDSGKSRTAPPPPISTAETYADLTRRITEIQKERRGYWQNILNAITK